MLRFVKLRFILIWAIRVRSFSSKFKLDDLLLLITWLIKII